MLFAVKAKRSTLMKYRALRERFALRGSQFGFR